MIKRSFPIYFLILTPTLIHCYTIRKSQVPIVKRVYKGPGAKVAKRLKIQYGLNSDFQVRNLRRYLKKYKRAEERKINYKNLKLESKRCITDKSVGKAKQKYTNNNLERLKDLRGVQM